MKNACNQVPFNFLLQQCFCLSKQQVLQFFKVLFLTVKHQLSRIHTGMLNDGCQHEMPGLYHLLPHLCSGVVRIRNRPPNLQTHTHSFNIFISTASYVPGILVLIHSTYHTLGQVVSIGICIGIMYVCVGIYTYTHWDEIDSELYKKQTKRNKFELLTQAWFWQRTSMSVHVHFSVKKLITRA